MSSSPRQRSAFRLGDWTVHPDLGVLRRGAEERRLVPKALEVLLALVDGSPRAVSRDALLDAVWGSSYPSDQVVGRAIADLRSALGERAGDARYIRTVPKFGYQLAMEPQDPEPAAGSPPLRSGRRLARPVLLVVGLLVTVLAVLAVVTAQRDAVPAGPGVVIRPLTAEPGLEQQPRLATATGAVIFSALADGSSDWDVWRLDPGSGLVEAVATEPGITEHGPAWFPGGRRVAYVRIGATGCAVVVRDLGADRTTTVGACTTRFPTVVDVSSDGALVAFTGDAPDGRRTLRIASMIGPENRAASSGVSPTGTDFYPRFSPDDRRLAFLRGEPHPDHRARLWIVDLDSGAERALTELPQRHGGMSWRDDSQLIASIESGGEMRLVQIGVEDGGAVDLGLAGVIQPEVDPTAAGRLVGVMRRQRTGLFRLAEDGGSTPVAASTWSERQGRFSPDGRWIAFVSDRSGSPELWLTASDGGRPRQLTALAGALVDHPAWSPDGRSLAFTARIPDREALYVIRVIDGDIAERSTGQRELGWPTWVDGERIVFSCADGGFRGLCIQEPGGAARELVPDLQRPQAVGEVLHAIDPNGGLHRVEPASGQSRALGVTLPGAGRFGWLVADGSVHFLAGDSEHAAVRRQPLDGGAVSLVAELPGALPDLAISRHPDDGSILLTRALSSSDDLIELILSP